MTAQVIAFVILFVVVALISVALDTPEFMLCAVVPFAIWAFVGAANASGDARAYQGRVKAALVSDYGATVSPATVRLLPGHNADRSDQVTLTVDGTHHACSVETTTSAKNLIVICAGAELPKLPPR